MTVWTVEWKVMWCRSEAFIRGETGNQQNQCNMVYCMANGIYSVQRTDSVPGQPDFKMMTLSQSWSSRLMSVSLVVVPNDYVSARLIK